MRGGDLVGQSRFVGNAIGHNQGGRTLRLNHRNGKAFHKEGNKTDPSLATGGLHPHMSPQECTWSVNGTVVHFFEWLFAIPRTNQQQVRCGLTPADIYEHLQEGLHGPVG